MTSRRLAIASLCALASAVLMVSACGASVDPPKVLVSSAGSTASTLSSSGPSTVVSGSAPSSATSPSSVPDAAHRVFAAMTEPQRIGQLFMVGTAATAADPSVVTQIATGEVGSVFLAGASARPASQTAALVASLQQQAGGVRLFVATDQEGGSVQRLRGPDFSAIPSALEQGAMTPAAELASATQWGRQLAAGGINLDLAPVLDTVASPAAAAHNPPIGELDREFGFSPGAVAATGTAFMQGLLAAGVDPTVKHFPGLGRVTSNTDTTSGVTDHVTTPHDPYLRPFMAAIAAGTPFVMVSLAIYSQIDAASPAVFSPTVITGLLRGELHFTGVVVSDDLGAARQVAAYPVGDRAVRFIAAGGDVVLTVSPAQIAPMTAAVLARAQADPAFVALVDAAVLRVLEAKQARGLVS